MYAFSVYFTLALGAVPEINAKQKLCNADCCCASRDFAA